MSLEETLVEASEEKHKTKNKERMQLSFNARLLS